MAKTKISEYSATANSNTDVASINIDENCAPSGINNAIRAVMGHLKDFQAGTNSDPFNGPVNGTVGATTAASGKFTTIEGTDTTDASSTTAAAVKTAGGLAVAKKLYVGTGGAVVDGLTVGKGAGSVATNTAVGASALQANTSGARNTVVGYQAAYSTTTGFEIDAFGAQALYSNTTGTENLSVGRNSSYANTTGTRNTVVGISSFSNNSTGSYNTSLGWQALLSNTTASNNTAVGYQAGYSITTGDYACFIGQGAGYAATTGRGNTFVGTGFANGCGSAVTTGGKNTILGAYTGNQGGLDIRTASNYIVLSDGDGNPRTWCNSSGAWIIGPSGGGQIEAYSASSCGRHNYYNDAGATRGANYFYYGGVEKGSITISSTATAYVTSSDYRLKNSVAPMTGALAKVAALKPCTYKWNSDGSDGQGFIAHELQAVVPQCVTGEKDAVDEDGNPQYQGIDTSFLVATLTAAIQELKAEFDAYKATHP